MKTLAFVCLLVCSTSVFAAPPVIRTMTIEADLDCYGTVSGTSSVVNGNTLTADYDTWIYIEFPLTNRPDSDDIISAELELASPSGSNGFSSSSVYRCNSGWTETSTRNDAFGYVTSSIVGYPRTVSGGHLFYDLYNTGGCYAIHTSTNQVVVRSSETSSPPKWNITYYAEDAKAGDANADGVFDSSDLLQVFVAGKYDTNLVADWSQGDWNNDGLFTSSDLVAALTASVYLNGDPVAAWEALNE